MNHNSRGQSAVVAQLVPKETFGQDVRALSPFGMDGENFDHSDLICSGLEELSRHLRWLDEDYQAGAFDRLETRARSIVLLADQLGLRRMGQVAADVVYCIDDPDEVALTATLSRLMRLMSQALDHAAGPISTY
ncbi:hypothetical protein [Pseudooctadecabacter jejudonensis]|uniref:Uncharacterized protein n=1 Tax=Pseudooctadecabacter jejudonensis TaxID=1391910 RepID=A0A1Y5S2A3_9RHOB|nr:hypothetical protein [Pseudooctadecabacter jejudonensis]SLN30467.1 hypothetical protein PSJ8397_01385 [Pseudooctadecabacter jejudonensis]